MSSQLKNLKNSLFWRISLVFLAIFILIGFAYVFIAVKSANRYYQETTQKLNADVAEKMLEEVTPFVDGKVNNEALGKLMHSMMAVNPNLEIYLLDPEGVILEYVVLKKKVKLNFVDIRPIKEFLNNEKDIFILGDDPKSSNNKKIFSATEVRENNKLLGYVYMILASEEYDTIASTLWDSYILKVGVNSFIITLIAAFVIGLLLVWLLTRNLRKVISTFRRFENGDLTARIPVKSNGELAQLSSTFNHMADTILANIEEMKKVDNLRKELIANVSHDLRNPLSIIHGYMETLVLKEKDLSGPEKGKYMQIILDNTTKLKNLVTELFELSKLEAKQIKPNKEPFGMAELLQDIAVKYQLEAKRKGVNLKTNFKENNLMVFADLAMIERVIQNLMDNAIKYTPAHQNIEILLDKKEDNLEISITNTGIGIAEEDLPRIFDRYFKSNHNFSNSSGSGLGLAIVKNILELHDSLIKVQSETDKFTRFIFQLPVYEKKPQLI
ncbi:ATP-binding protein [soil metagenome]